MSDTDLIPGADEPFDLERAPLDQEDPLDIDWGGDGTDPTRPVRAHVLAALRPAAGPYEPPLDALLAAGELVGTALEERRDELGIGQEHVPELLRMVRDRQLNTADGSTEAVWGPLNALRMLAGLDLEGHVAELVPLYDLDFDLVAEELGELLGDVGAPAIGPLGAYLADRSRWSWGRVRATDALKEVARRHPEARDEVVAILSQTLAAPEGEPTELLSGTVANLIDLRAVEALPLIRRAYERDLIDETLPGPWGEVLSELGVAPDPDDALVEESRRRFEERTSQMLPADMRVNLAALEAAQQAQRPGSAPRASGQQRKQGQARKAKNKRKTSSASRKANRKKKR